MLSPSPRCSVGGLQTSLSCWVGPSGEALGTPRRVPSPSHWTWGPRGRAWAWSPGPFSSGPHTLVPESTFFPDVQQERPFPPALEAGLRGLWGNVSPLV